MIVVSCVVDDSPKFLMQAWNWLLCLHVTGAANRHDVKIIVHYPQRMDPERLSIYRSLGAELVTFEPFGEGKAVYCNKLRQLETPAVREADWAILCDADLVMTCDLAKLAAGDAARGKIVDVANPPADVWRPLFTAAGLIDRVELRAPSAVPESTTPSANWNGGLYVLPQTAIPALAEAWPRWARFCLGRNDLLGAWTHHADQLGFAMAAVETGLKTDPLPPSENFPTNLSADAYNFFEVGPINTFHYHNRTDDRGAMLRVGVDWIDRQIDEANATIMRMQREFFSQPIAEEYRQYLEGKLSWGSRITRRVKRLVAAGRIPKP